MNKIKNYLFSVSLAGVIVVLGIEVFAASAKEVKISDSGIRRRDTDRYKSTSSVREELD